MKIENKIDIFNIPEYVTCKVCMGTYKRISSSHLKKHNLTFKQYIKKYPGAILTCSSTRLKRSKALKSYIKNHPEWIKSPDVLKKLTDKRNTIKARNKQLINQKLVLNLPCYKKQNSELRKKHWKYLKESNKDKEFNKKVSDGIKNYLKNNPDVAMKRLKNMENGRNIYYKKLKKVKEEKKPSIIKLLKQGDSLMEIGRKVGVSAPTVKAWIEEEKISIEKYKNAKKTEALKMHKKGFTIEQIAHKFNRSPNSIIYSWLKD